MGPKNLAVVLAPRKRMFEGMVIDGKCLELALEAQNEKDRRPPPGAAAFNAPSPMKSWANFNICVQQVPTSHTKIWLRYVEVRKNRRSIGGQAVV